MADDDLWGESIFGVGMISKRQVLILSASIIAVCLVVQQCVGSDNGLESESDAGTGSAGEEAAVSGGGRPGEVDSSPAPDSAATAAAEDGATRRELPQISPELICILDLLSCQQFSNVGM